MSDGTISNAYTMDSGGVSATGADREFTAHGPIVPGEKFDAGKVRPILIPGSVYAALLAYGPNSPSFAWLRFKERVQILSEQVIALAWLPALYACADCLIQTGTDRTEVYHLAGLIPILEVLEFGAIKYDTNSWQRLPNGPVRYRESAMRHLLAVHDGEHTDPESGLSHLAHLGCNLMFLVWLESQTITPVTP